TVVHASTPAACNCLTSEVVNVPNIDHTTEGLLAPGCFAASNANWSFSSQPLLKFTGLSSTPSAAASSCAMATAWLSSSGCLAKRLMPKVSTWTSSSCSCAPSVDIVPHANVPMLPAAAADRKSTRLNSSHVSI